MATHEWDDLVTGWDEWTGADAARFAWVGVLVVSGAVKYWTGVLISGDVHGGIGCV